MRRVFADTAYGIALANRKDQLHARAMAVSRSLGAAGLFTTDEVLTEFLAHFSGHGPVLRDLAARTVEDLLADPVIEVKPQSRRSFLDGLSLYRARPDKGYSLTDCVSMTWMQHERIAEVLTHDAHFTQEGFVVLL